VEGRCQGDNATLGSTDVENCKPVDYQLPKNDSVPLS
jgi:hypothetical protein